MRDREVEEALHWFSRNDCHSLVATLEESVAGDEIQTRLGLFSTVTFDAVFLKDSAHGFSEQVLARGHLCRVLLLDCPRRIGQTDEYKDESHDGHHSEPLCDDQVTSPKVGRPERLFPDVLLSWYKRSRDRVMSGFSDLNDPFSAGKGRVQAPLRG